MCWGFVLEISAIVCVHTWNYDSDCLYHLSRVLGLDFMDAINIYIVVFVWMHVLGMTPYKWTWSLSTLKYETRNSRGWNMCFFFIFQNCNICKTHSIHQTGALANTYDMILSKNMPKPTPNDDVDPWWCTFVSSLLTSHVCRVCNATETPSSALELV